MNFTFLIINFCYLSIKSVKAFSCRKSGYLISINSECTFKLFESESIVAFILELTRTLLLGCGLLYFYWLLLYTVRSLYFGKSKTKQFPVLGGKNNQKLKIVLHFFWHLFFSQKFFLLMIFAGSIISQKTQEDSCLDIWAAFSSFSLSLLFCSSLLSEFSPPILETSYLNSDIYLNSVTLLSLFRFPSLC